MIKLSQWAKNNNLTYPTAYAMFKARNLPCKSIQLKTGTILVESEINKNENMIEVDLKENTEFINAKLINTNNNFTIDDNFKIIKDFVGEKESNLENFSIDKIEDLFKIIDNKIKVVNLTKTEKEEESIKIKSFNIDDVVKYFDPDSEFKLNYFDLNQKIEKLNEDKNKAQKQFCLAKAEICRIDKLIASYYNGFIFEINKKIEEKKVEEKENLYKKNNEEELKTAPIRELKNIKKITTDYFLKSNIEDRLFLLLKDKKSEIEDGYKL